MGCFGNNRQPVQFDGYGPCFQPQPVCPHHWASRHRRRRSDSCQAGSGAPGSENSAAFAESIARVEPGKPASYSQPPSAAAGDRVANTDASALANTSGHRCWWSGGRPWVSTHTHTNTDPYFHTDTDTDTDADSHFHADAKTNGGTDANTHIDAKTNGGTHADADPNAYTNGGTNANADTDPNTDADPNTNGGTYADPNAYTNGGTYADAYTNADPNAYTNGGTYADADIHADIHADSDGCAYSRSYANAHTRSWRPHSFPVRPNREFRDHDHGSGWAQSGESHKWSSLRLGSLVVRERCSGLCLWPGWQS